MTTSPTKKAIHYLLALILLLILSLKGYAEQDARIQLLSLAFIIIGALVWIFTLLRTQASLDLPKITLPLGLLALYALANVGRAPLPFYSLEPALLVVLYLGLFIFFCDSLRRSWSPTAWETAIHAIAVFAALASVLELVNWLNEWRQVQGSLWPLPPFSLRSSGSFLYHPNTLAAFISLALPLSILRITREHRTFRRTIWVLISVSYFLSLYLASSRSTWLATLAALGALYLMLHGATLWAILRRRLSLTAEALRRLLPGALGLAALAGFVLFIFFYNVQAAPGHGSVGSGGSGRLNFWSDAIQFFRNAPLLGQGTDSYRILYVIENQIPPGWPAPHPHQLWVQIASDLGLVGLALTAWVLGILFLSFYRLWIHTPPERRFQPAAYAASLTALLVHHCFDYGFWLPLYAAAAFILLALLLQSAPKQVKYQLKPRPLMVLAGLILLLYAGGRIFVLRGAMQFQRGVSQAYAADWASASEQICAVADAYPNNTHYIYQCSLAQATLASLQTDPAHLEQALYFQQRGVQADPYWSVHWANLAVLEWVNGNEEDAIEKLSFALDLAPMNARYLLNLGWLHEQRGDSKQALARYQQALALDPELSASVFFVQPGLRQRATEEQHSLASIGKLNDPAQQGWLLLDLGRLDQAQASFERALEETPFRGLAYAGMAHIQHLLGDVQSARSFADLALFTHEDLPDVYWVAYELALDLGEDDLVEQHSRSLYQSLRYDLQSRGFSFGLYRRIMLPWDTVPQMQSGVMKARYIPAVENWEDILRSRGDETQADEVQWWLEMQTGESSSH